MIAAALKLDIERYAAGMHRTNALYVGAATGRLTPEIVGFYLFNVRHLVQHTPLHLERARRRALALGRTDLAEHFSQKLVEEHGHDRWADGDLSLFRERFGSDADGSLAPALLTQLRWIEALIDRDPALYLAYILFAEYLIVLMGPSWLSMVEARCGIPRQMLSVIGNHAELDKDHTDEGLDAIDALVREPRQIGPMRETVARAIALFERWSGEVLAHGVLSQSLRPEEPSSWTRASFA